ncbi:hypothetical protein [Pseudoalteromonas sp. SR43-5]|uniref:hypothetical protein n=1 Tax=Pseudoalteromonas sp. SR43-5 TaxID=2760941 RepID=UPI0015FA8CF8|nr:hypothetical protein [Pseudoalteromonas sp. SR43-5]MBB1306203.1 hypothetical protein [Pseudoalteromonas sp. SR43-5]
MSDDKVFVKYEKEIDDCYDEHDHYLKYRSGIDESELKNSEASDKAILTISSVAIGLLFNYSKNYSSIDSQINNLLLICGWFFIAGSMTLVIISMYFSGVMLSRNRKRIDSILRERSNLIRELYEYEEVGKESNFKIKKVKLDKIKFKEPKVLGFFTRIFHYSSPIFLIIGILLVGIYFAFNLSESSKTNGQIKPTLNKVINSTHIINKEEVNNGRTRSENTNTTTASSSKETK